MSFLLSCPHCGPRDVNEFATTGEVLTRPRPPGGSESQGSWRPSVRELTDYVYFRRNVAGVQREWWYHRAGCGTWFLAERDTRTNEVLKVELPAARPPARGADVPPGAGEASP
jgi:sarcosine oxidase subunit delta